MKLFRAHEFAESAGVTVRALHHYDRLGLLSPTGRTEAGYRLYSSRDLVRLEQILVFKLLGVPLKEMRDLLERSPADLAETIDLQRRALLEKRRQLNVTLQALDEAQQSVSTGLAPDHEMFKTILKVIEMQNNIDWSTKYYSDEAKAKVEERKNLWSPELQARVTEQWQTLVKDIEANLHEDPASEVAQGLAFRWVELVRGFTGGDVEIQKGLNKMWADKQNWPQEAKQRSPIPENVNTFIIKAMSAKTRGGRE